MRNHYVELLVTLAGPDPFHQPMPIDWLSGLLADLDTNGLLAVWAEESDDPDAAWTAIRESQVLVRRLKELITAGPAAKR